MCIAVLSASAAVGGVERGVRGGTSDADRSRMISNKTFNKVLKGVIAAMPAIPYVTKRRSSMVMPFVLGGIGVALVGGVAAVMFLSPRTRYRALDVAKNTYGKINTQISQLTNKGSIEHQPLANGMASEQGAGYASTGL